MPIDVAQPSRRLSKFWLFTYYDDELESMYLESRQSALDQFKERVAYAIWQLERCPVTQRLHLQGYIEFKQKVRLTQLRSYLPRAHWDERRGTQAQAHDYCSKEETRIDGPYEIGQYVAHDIQGRRSDLVAVKRKLDSGVELRLIAQTEEHFSACCRHYRFFERYVHLTDNPRSWKTLVYVYWGPTGVGKSSHVREVAGDDAFYASKSTAGGYKWFDGYTGQSIAVFDEFYGSIPFHMLLDLIGFMPMLVEWKGASRQWKPRTIFITSNRSPLDWYTDIRLNHASLYRRLTRVFYVAAFDTATEDCDFPRGQDEEKEA